VNKCLGFKFEFISLISSAVNKCASFLSMRRGSHGFIRAAGGLCVVDVPGVENVNLSPIVEGHFDYARKMEEIEDVLGIYNA
jgi:Protein of unknown function (DUF726)